MNRETWSRSFAVLLTLLCLITAIAYVAEPFDFDLRDTPTQSQVQGASAGAQRTVPAPATIKAASGEPADRQIVFKIFLLTSFACAAGWFAYAFTGDPLARRQEQVKFAYFFVIGAFAVLMIPPFVKSQAIGSEPIGIVSGCVADAEAAAQLRCDPDQQLPAKTGEQVEAGKVAAPGNTAPGTGTAPKPAHNQWLVNLGGALRLQSDKQCESRRPEECKPGSSGNRVDITGGVVVPLPFVIIALFGGAISLSRRVPEIQKRSEPGFVGTEAEPVLDARLAREELLFQIMQFISAPLIAITAHQVIQPSGQASAVALAFLAGFGSETILLMIRGIANGIEPKGASQRATATVGENNRQQTADTATAGTLGADSQPEPLRLGHAPEGDPSMVPVQIRLCVDDDGIEAGSLALSVDGLPASVPSDGCVELPLAPGQPHRVEAHGRRAGQEVRGELALTANADDDGRPFQLVLS